MKRSLLYFVMIAVAFTALTGSIQSQSWRKVVSASYSTFTKIKMINENTGYAVGVVGNICKTTDGGKNWIKQSSGLNTDLSSLFFFDEQKGFAAGASRRFLTTTDGGNNWKVDSIMTIPNAKASIRSIYFSDAQTGWIMAASTSSGATASYIYKTTDGGTNWTEVFSLAGKNMIDMNFYAANKGIACGKDIDVIYYTTDGTTWTKSARPDLAGVQYTRSDLRAVHMVSENVAYMTGWGNKDAGLQPTIYFKTTDGGATWTYQMQQESNRTYDNLYGIYFKDENNGIAIGGGSTITKTTDGGANWIRISSPYGATLQGLSVIGDKIWVVGDGGLIIYSPDFGATWEQLTPVPSAALNSVQFPAKNIGYAGGFDGIFMKTTDYGRSWKAKFLNIGHAVYNIQDMQFLSEKVGYAAHSYKMVTKTTDGGETWKAVIPDTTSALSVSFGLYFLNENLGYVVGKDGTNVDVIRKTTDGGATWNATYSIVGKDLYEVHFADELHGIVVGNALKVAYTSDGGSTWHEGTVNGLSTTPNLRSVYFLNSTTAVAVGIGVIIKSTDGGATWNAVTVNGLTETLQSVIFKDAQTGWTAGSKTTAPKKTSLYQTTDGGNTWTDVIDPVVSNNETIYDVSLDINGALWFGCASSTIFTNADVTSVKDNAVSVSGYDLYQNYPNPFNPSTEIIYNIAQSGNVRLNVYDVMGRLTATLVNEYQQSGSHKVRFNGADMASGIYFYTLNVNGKVLTNKMTLIK